MMSSGAAAHGEEYEGLDKYGSQRSWTLTRSDWSKASFLRSSVPRLAISRVVSVKSCL